ncbi:cAMP-binding domain of CRP or a regulatory subunit of cAMP-dependent protein kinases [Oryzisolibacter propanilivorax]|uniref:cAMP-binding domain of CRP or a regulatory subunit of cAMP-dependent protein kinases n=1 Tax=Oryzisolibacter propanilivorax TaxID=1527607 RepID=A0A1G9TM98_9BURK|nr:Crp/Fnr family transcriptional regulator [Oryzisolibacter propanilivorax]SDM48668.1 cAMP-binding domain of CRP or a regulatory subunit of cAMP-dependent protein kinases [Oryzisolibacter propanilivorax]
MTFINAPGTGVACAPRAAGAPPAPAAHAAALALLAGNRLLQGTPAAALDALARQALLRSHGDGQVLFHEGEAASHCLLVERGAIEVLRYAACGDERMLHRFGVGELVAEAAMFMPHGLYPMTARAHGAARVWRLPRAALRGACEAHPALALRLLEALSQRLYRRVNEVEWLTASSAPQRLAAYLLAQHGVQGDEVQLPTSQRQLAAQLGIRAETLNRLLAQWQAQGWIAGEKRRWQLGDAARLRQLAEPGARAF